MSSRMEYTSFHLMISTAIVAIREQVGDRAADDAIPLVLEPMHLDPVWRDALEALELLEAADELLALLDDDRGL